MTQEQVVNISLEISYKMLLSGAEIYRVEQCVRYISNAYGFPDSDCFAILTSIVVTVMDEDKICTRTKRVNRRSTDLGKVARLNDLSRYICKYKPDYQTVCKLIKEIDHMKPYSFWTITAIYVMVSFFFAKFYNGTFTAAVITGLIGVFVHPIQWIGDRIGSNLFFTNMITSAVLTTCACAVHVLFYSNELDIIIISLIMNLVPGVALTHCMRDLISNELISGLARMAEVLISATGTAVGVFFILSLFQITL